MNKGKRFKEKRIKNANSFLIIYFIILFIFIDFSFSKYSTKLEGETNAKVAKFSIIVNDKKIGEEETFELVLSDDNEITNKLIPGGEGYFEIIINPTETQVNLEYEILFDLSEINTENRKISLIKYSMDDGNTFVEMPEDNKIIGEINIVESYENIEDCIVTLRVYWSWKEGEDIINPTFENAKIKVTSIIKQKD